MRKYKNNEESAVITNCRHCFHKKCLFKWINGKDTGTVTPCPYCSENFSN
jgi:Ring finger domain